MLKIIFSQIKSKTKKTKKTKRIKMTEDDEGGGGDLPKAAKAAEDRDDGATKGPLGKEGEKDGGGEPNMEELERTFF